MKLIASLLFIFSLALTSFAQEIQIPDDLRLEEKEDYDKTEDLVLESIEWLNNVPLPKLDFKRKEIYSFLIQWMEGSPTVTIELHSKLMPSDCADCLILFMSGWTKYSLENDYSKNKVEGAMAGLEMAISFYETNKVRLGKNSSMKKFIKKKEKGTLREYVVEQFED